MDTRDNKLYSSSSSDGLTSDEFLAREKALYGVAYYTQFSERFDSEIAAMFAEAAEETPSQRKAYAE